MCCTAECMACGASVPVRICYVSRLHGQPQLWLHAGWDVVEVEGQSSPLCCYAEGLGEVPAVLLCKPA